VITRTTTSGPPPVIHTLVLPPGTVTTGVPRIGKPGNGSITLQSNATTKFLGVTGTKHHGTHFHISRSNFHVKTNVGANAKSFNVTTLGVKSLTVRTPTLRVVNVKTPTIKVPTIRVPTVRVPTVRIP
jgi:hypothetical protein